MSNELISVSNGAKEIAKITIGAISFERISDRLDNNWALWEVSANLPTGETVNGFMQAEVYAPDCGYDTTLELDSE